MESSLIAVKDLHYSISEGTTCRQILRGIDLEVQAGESVALLGRSGSGKSTLLNLICGIDKPDSGTISIDGHEISTLKEPDLTLYRRQHIGFIYQFFHLVTTLNVMENIALPLELNRWPRTAIEQRTEELIEQVGLSGYQSRFPDQLSGGEQQRVAIARAIAHKPSLLLADEPTGNLDAQIGRDVMQMLNQLVKQEGLTLVLVTHSQSVAKGAHRIMTLEQGLLAERVGDFAW